MAKQKTEVEKQKTKMIKQQNKNQKIKNKNEKIKNKNEKTKKNKNTKKNRNTKRNKKTKKNKEKQKNKRTKKNRKIKKNRKTKKNEEIKKNKKTKKNKKKRKTEKPVRCPPIASCSQQASSWPGGCMRCHRSRSAATAQRESHKILILRRCWIARFCYRGLHRGRPHQCASGPRKSENLIVRIHIASLRTIEFPDFPTSDAPYDTPFAAGLNSTGQRLDP